MRDSATGGNAYGPPWLLVRARIAKEWGVPPWTVDEPELADEVGRQIDVWNLTARHGRRGATMNEEGR